MRQLATMLLLGALLASIACGGGGGGPTEPLPNPTISSVSPNQARPGDQVTIAGSNLGGAQATVTFNGVTAQVMTASATSILAILPNIAAGPATVRVTSGNRSASFSGFSVLSDPTAVEGTYHLWVSIAVDECTGQASSFSSQVTIERDGDNVAFIFGDAATLTGTIDSESRIMTVDGTILVPFPPPGTGTFPGQMHMEARVTYGSLAAVGTITFEGTFPGVSGTCREFFNITGNRLNRSVLPLTGP